jgi:Flp pilus assembly pilin Flp
MKNKYGRTKAQSTIEYAMMVACLAAALIGMQIYIKRGVQGRIRSAADEIGGQYSATTTRSSLTQSIANPTPVNITGRTVFKNITWTDRYTGAVHQNEPVELMEVTRNEQTVVNIESGSYEETGRLSDENLFNR